MALELSSCGECLIYVAVLASRLDWLFSLHTLKLLQENSTSLRNVRSRVKSTTANVVHLPSVFLYHMDVFVSVSLASLATGLPANVSISVTFTRISFSLLGSYFYTVFHENRRHVFNNPVETEPILIVFGTES